MGYVRRKRRSLKIKHMKNEQEERARQLASIAVAGFALIALLTLAILFTGCVSKHPKCAAYDKVQTID